MNLWPTEILATVAQGGRSPSARPLTSAEIEIATAAAARGENAASASMKAGGGNFLERTLGWKKTAKGYVTKGGTSVPTWLVYTALAGAGLLLLKGGK